MAGIFMHMIGYSINRGFTELGVRGVRYFGVVWTQTFANLPHPLNITWMSLACRDPEERSLAMAMYVNTISDPRFRVSSGRVSKSVDR